MKKIEPFKIIESFRGIVLCAVQFSSVAQSCLTLCDPMNCSMPCLPVHQQLQSSLRLMTIKSVKPSSHLPLASPSPPTPNPSQHQSLFQ